MSDDNRLEEKDIREISSEENYDADLLKKVCNFTTGKKREIEKALDKYKLQGQTVLHVGCGGKIHKAVSEPYFTNGFSMVGLDAHKIYLKEFTSHFNTAGVLANAANLPFDQNTFDIVNYTDIIEHLINPVQALHEVNRVLKNGGIIIISTHNRHSGRIGKPEVLNPFYLAEQVIGLYFNSILTPHNFIDKWMDFEFYHTEFTRKELLNLLNICGFVIMEFSTKSLKVESNILKRYVRLLIGYLPVFKWLINPFFVVAKTSKKHDSFIISSHYTGRGR
jgi:ubiquinone/menaquinone biosynthesis C-methylase UbiE